MIRQNTDESILCVCCTNHALDQFLEHLLMNGEQKIVRIGGRSKSIKLQGFQLRELARHKAKLAPDASKRLNRVIATLHRSHEEIEGLIDVLNRPIEWNAPSGGVHQLLICEDTDKLDFLTVPNSQFGFNIIGRDNKDIKEDYLWLCWKKGSDFSVWLKMKIPPHKNLRPYGQWATARG